MTNEDFHRRIEVVGPFLKDRDGLSVHVATKRVALQEKRRCGEVSQAWIPVSGFEHFQLSMAMLPVLFEGFIVDAKWRFVARKANWRCEPCCVPRLDQPVLVGCRDSAAGIDRPMLRFQGECGRLIECSPLVLAQALFFPSSAFVRLAEEGSLHSRVRGERQGFRGVIEIAESAAIPKSAFREPHVRALLSLLVFHQEMRRSFNNIARELLAAAPNQHFNFRLPALSRLTISGFGDKPWRPEGPFILRQITSLKLSQDTWAQVPHDIEFVARNLGTSFRLAEASGEGGKVYTREDKQHSVVPEIRTDRKRLPCAPPRAVEMKVKAPLVSIPAIRFQLNAAGGVDEIGGTVVPKAADPAESLAAGAGFGLSRTRPAEFGQSTVVTSEDLANSSLNGLGAIQEAVAVRHAAWQLSLSVLPLPRWRQAKKSLHKLKDGSDRRLGFLEVQMPAGALTLLEIENTDQKRSLGTLLVDGGFSEEERHQLAKSIITRSLNWDFKHFNEKHRVLASFKHLHEPQAERILRVINTLEAIACSPVLEGF